MKPLVLTNKLMTYVDDDAYELLHYYHWKAHPIINGHVANRNVSIDGFVKTMYMHRIIAGVPQCFNVKWKNGNKLDNQYENLLITDKTGNVYKNKPFNGESNYKGVKWSSYYGVWEARFSGMTIGYYFNEIDAARAYNIKMVEIFKKPGRGRLNKIGIMRSYLILNNKTPALEIK